MTALCFVGMLAAAFLPETLNQHLPESIQDADDFGKNNKFWSLLPPTYIVESKDGNQS
jgi:hypothetical protein